MDAKLFYMFTFLDTPILVRILLGEKITLV